MLCHLILFYEKEIYFIGSFRNIEITFEQIYNHSIFPFRFAGRCNSQTHPNIFQICLKYRKTIFTLVSYEVNENLTRFFGLNIDF